LFFFVAVVAVICAAAVVSSKPVTLCRFRFNPISSIEITYDRACDRSTPLYYSVKQGKKTSIEPCTFAFVGCTCDIQPSQLRMVQLANNIVAIEESYVDANNWRVVIIHDFGTNQSYPANISQQEISKHLQDPPIFSIISHGK
jgi:hypothetical protein